MAMDRFRPCQFILFSPTSSGTVRPPGSGFSPAVRSMTHLRLKRWGAVDLAWTMSIVAEVLFVIGLGVLIAHAWANLPPDAVT